MRFCRKRQPRMHCFQRSIIICKKSAELCQSYWYLLILLSVSLFMNFDFSSSWFFISKLMSCSRCFARILPGTFHVRGYVVDGRRRTDRSRRRHRRREPRSLGASFSADSSLEVNLYPFGGLADSLSLARALRRGRDLLFFGKKRIETRHAVMIPWVMLHFFPNNLDVDALCDYVILFIMWPSHHTRLVSAREGKTPGSLTEAAWCASSADKRQKHSASQCRTWGYPKHVPKMSQKKWIPGHQLVCLLEIDFSGRGYNFATEMWAISTCFGEETLTVRPTRILFGSETCPQCDTCDSDKKHSWHSWSPIETTFFNHSSRVCSIGSRLRKSMLVFFILSSTKIN